MNFFRQFSFFFLLFIPFSLTAQISLEVSPKSQDEKLPEKFERVILPMLNMELIEAENQLREDNGQLPEIGKLIATEISLRTHGNWTNLANGDRVWRVGIESDGALALSIYYSKFDLPEHSTLHIYNNSRSEVIGAFSSHNNPKKEEFATGLVRGDKIILEYYEPASAFNQGNMAISHVGHAFMDIPPLQTEKNFGDSDPCQVNVNCSEGDDWQDQKRGVTRILLKIGNGFYWCSGSLVNNTAQTCAPYVLSAWHCGEGASTADMNQWIFYFNYEAAGCPNPATEPGSNSITGATMRANSNDGGGNTGSDFMLVELNTTIPDIFNPYYNGWSRINNTSPSGIGIHHPSGDIKKISTYSTNLVSTTWGGTPDTHWRVTWVATANGHGVTEGGSSGSPIFNNNGLIIGDLTGGGSFCNTPTAPDRYGKFSYSWDSNGNTAATRLSDWLDPNNTGVSTLTGTNQPCSTGTCSNGILDGDETGVDCGGSCPPCPTCDDGIMNGNETGIDCGGPDCTPCPPEYCGSTGTDASYEWIDLVSFGTINNTSGSDGGYADYTDQSSIVEPGSSYPIALTPGFSGQSYAEFWRVWIDYNSDADFDDQDELVFEANGTSIINGNIMIPPGIPAATTRMRVSMQYNLNAGQCDTFQYGEVEDYTIIIQPNDPLTYFCPKVLLEGSFNPFTTGPADRMRTTLREANLIPVNQPFNSAPWDYPGSESFPSPSAIPADMVDWVMVVIREGATPSTVLERYAGVLHADGSITNTNGDLAGFPVVSASGFYVEIFHRSHLPIISTVPLFPDLNGMICHDFAINMNQAFRNIVLNDDPQVEMNSVAGLFYGMITGNSLPLDCQIDINDVNALFLIYNSNPYYGVEDVNMDGVVELNDINALFNSYNSNCHRPY